jgi:hypothetical protein
MPGILRSGRSARWAGAFVATLACAIVAGISFFMLLGLWGLVFAPFITLGSSSFLIIVALACSAALTVMAYRAWYRRLSLRR